MKLSCTKENLLAALSILTGIATKNINLPILGNILIKVSEQKVEMISTNLETAITTHVRAKIESTGSFTVPAKTLMDFVNLLPDEKIDLEVDNSELEIKCGKSKTKIKGTSAEDYPVIPTVESGEGYLFKALDFKKALNQTLPAVAKNDIRPELSGIFMGFNTENNPELILAATDSYRLAEKKIKIEQGQKEIKIILPGRTAQEVVRVLAQATNESESSVRIVVGESQVVFRYGEVEIISRLVDGEYPDYTQIIPSEFKTKAVFNKGNFVKEVKSASLFTVSGVNAVSVDLNVSQGTIGVSSTSTQTGEYSSETPAEIEGEENSILLNHRYLLDGLNNLDGDLGVMQTVSADNPCVFKSKSDDSYLYIIMPIRK